MTAISPVGTDPAAGLRVVRIEVWTRDGEIDAAAEMTRREAAGVLPGVRGVRSAMVYLIESPLDEQAAADVATQLLTDPVSQTFHLGAMPAEGGAATVEVHYQPGVMDPVAQSTQAAIAEMLPDLDEAQVAVRTGRRYDVMSDEPIDGPALQRFAQGHLGNPVIQSFHDQPFWPGTFPHGHQYELKVTHVPIRDLDDEQLRKLSREAHLFLSPAEMQAIRDYYRDAGREPTDVELETLAQTWSEHCVHKTLKSTVTYRERPAASRTQRRRDGDPDAAAEVGSATEAAGTTDIFDGLPNTARAADGTLTIANLLKSTVAAATAQLKADGLDDWLVSVFDDNSGIVRFDDTHGVCIKVETHNHPSAIEPYGGAATGIGGCIRDIMGTGLFALPIANTDSFCVAPPDMGTAPAASQTQRRREEHGSHAGAEVGSATEAAGLPKGVIPPKRTLQQVVAGVRDYGNRMGIPTVNGMVYFDPAYVGNPLVFAGCIGLIPLDKCFGTPKPGDRIIILGGATGRDGIHGATFSSAELTDTHADEFSHAVQIGNAITQKKTLDVILKARDYVDPETGETRCLFNAISDCGAGGFSSAVGEMGEKVGARVTLETAPLKYAGLSYTEIWISEAQERMPLAVPAENVPALRALCAAENVDFCDLGEFGYEEDGEPTLLLTYGGQEVGKLSMAFMHDGIPTPVREATWPPAASSSPLRETPQRRRVSDHAAAEAGPAAEAAGLQADLLALLAHPNIASKHWIIRQYDHEVQGASVVKPLVGPEQDGPSDAAVLRPKLNSHRGVALSNGVAPNLGEHARQVGLADDGDSHWATLAAIDEAVRNAVCVGANPERIAILDNFCWPGCDDPAQLGTLVRAAVGCYRGALAYRTPFVSGKDSLNNQFTTEDGRRIAIPQTLLITAMGMVDDVRLARTMDAKRPGSVLLIVGETGPAMGGSHHAMLTGTSGPIPRVDLKQGPKHARAVAGLLRDRRVLSAHDCSDGGLLVAAAEMAFAGRVGLDIDLSALPITGELDTEQMAFAETPSRYLLEVASDKLEAVAKALDRAGVAYGRVGAFADHDRFTVRCPKAAKVVDLPLQTLLDTWRRPLDW